MQLLALVCVAASALASQPSALKPIAAPLRELEWGQLNFLHTSDTHGWHAGHLKEPSFGADWGDYISFAKHMRKKADAEGRDLLVVDTGDRVEGNGLYDASSPKGKYTSEIIKHLDVDIITPGNHELYKARTSGAELETTVPNFKESYIASNVDVLDPESREMIPLAQRFRKFKTKNLGIRITAFGFLYNFQQYNNESYVQPVQETIKEDWFQDAIREKDVDLFVVAGHVGADSDEYEIIFNEIRGVQWDVPIQFFAGHTHIRDFRKYDKLAAAIESGRYMETIGFASIDGFKVKKQGEARVAASIKFKRRYIDNNLYSMHHHSGLNSSTFPTKSGKRVSRQIDKDRKAVGLDHRYGCAPTTLWLSRVPADNPDSLLRWLSDEVFPDSFGHEGNESAKVPTLALTNTGAIRFDLFGGNFTEDSRYQICPFTSGFRRISNVNYKVASRLQRVLNEEVPGLSNLSPKLDPTLLLPPEQLAFRKASNARSSTRMSHNDAQVVFQDATENLIPGYTTKDDAGSDGDDTIHLPIQFVPIPNVIQSRIDFPKRKRHGDGKYKGEEPKSVDVVFNEFIEPWVVMALEFLGSKYGANDTMSYADGQSMTSIITQWVEKNWRCDD